MPRSPRPRAAFARHRSHRLRAALQLAPLLFSLVLAGTWVALPRSARACSCAATDLAARQDAAAAVFEGRVRAIARSGDAEVGPATLTVTLEVVQTWKGADTETVVVTTMSDAAACGVPFEEGRSYLVFATRDASGALVVGLCGGTTLREQVDDDVAALGAGVTPVDVQDAPTRLRPAAPGAGGCASCRVGSAGTRGDAATNAVATLALGVVATLAAVRRKNRSRRRAGAPRWPLSP